MKTKGIVLSLFASTMIQLPNGFAKNYQSATELTQSKQSKFEFYPVKLSKSEIKDGLVMNGKSFIPLTKKPALTVSDFQYQKLPGNQISIKLLLNEKDNKALDGITKKYINTKLAVVYNGEVLMAPSVKSIVGESSLQLTFKSPKKFEELLRSFA